MPSSSERIKDVSGGMAQFKALLAAHTAGPSVAHFWADWADQCGPMDEAIKILSAQPDLAKTQFVRVDAEKEADVSMELEVAAVPTILMFSPGGKRIVDRVEGAKVPDVVKMVRVCKTRCDKTC